jgi:hypothetical protein
MKEFFNTIPKWAWYTLAFGVAGTLLVLAIAVGQRIISHGAKVVWSGEGGEVLLYKKVEEEAEQGWPTQELILIEDQENPPVIEDDK